MAVPSGYSYWKRPGERGKTVVMVVMWAALLTMLIADYLGNMEELAESGGLTGRKLLIAAASLGILLSLSRLLIGAIVRDQRQELRLEALSFVFLAVAWIAAGFALGLMGSILWLAILAAIFLGIAFFLYRNRQAM